MFYGRLNAEKFLVTTFQLGLVSQVAEKYSGIRRVPVKMEHVIKRLLSPNGTADIVDWWMVSVIANLIAQIAMILSVGWWLFGHTN